MSLVQDSGLRATLAECRSCGCPLSLPTREHALIDERGWAHVPCVCGEINQLPFENVEEVRSIQRRRPSWQIAALWIVILALIALLLPVMRREPQAEPPPPPYLTT